MMRAVIGAVVGLMLGLLIGVDLVLLGVLAMDTYIVFLLALAGLVLGAWSGRRAARRRGGGAALAR